MEGARILSHGLCPHRLLMDQYKAVYISVCEDTD